MGVTISKLKLTKINHEIPAEDWLTGIQMSLVETVNNENGAFLFAKEKTVTFRNFFAHESLCQKFDQLRSHMALICDYYSKANKVTPATLENVLEIAPSIFVNQVVFTGADDSAGVMLGGFKLICGDKQLNLITPNIKLDGDEYQFSEQLFELLQDIEIEAKAAYLQKRRKVVQGELPFEDDQTGGADSDAVFGTALEANGLKVKVMKGNG